MVIVVSLVALAAVSAAGVWWGMSRREPSALEVRSNLGFGAEEEVADLFVLLPSDSPPARLDRPSVTRSLARLGLTVAVTTALLVGVAYLIGFVLKLHLDRYFSTGG
ncbi:MAG: hypothetical protein ACRDH9_07160 [Actinomycetota bacterium]